MKVLLLVVFTALIMTSCGSSPAAPNEAPGASTLSTVINFALVQLSWTQCSADDFAEYRLYRSTVAGISGNPGTPVATFTNASDLSYNDATVVQDQDYYYAIQTVDTGDLSSWSNEVLAHTPVEANAGDWSGTTTQGKPITFTVTTNHTLGDLSVELDISLAPDLTWQLTDYGPYGTDGTWAGSWTSTSGGDTHTISIEGDFDASNVCTGSLVAASTSYYGGYYIEADFTVNPD